MLRLSYFLLPPGSELQSHIIERYNELSNNWNGNAVYQRFKLINKLNRIETFFSGIFLK